jgi:hypothetical protein
MLYTNEEVVLASDFERLERTLLQVQGERDRIRQETLEEAAKVCANHLAWLSYTNIGGVNAEKMRTASTLLDAIRALGEKPVSTLIEK